jgi:hypothetical protein
MRDYTEIACIERNGFDIIVDRTWEDIDPRDHFEPEDAEEICDKINKGIYEWFMLRVRVLLAGHVMATEYLGGCLYKDSHDVMTDGLADDLIFQALCEAKEEIVRMKALMAEVDLDTMTD